MLSRLFSRKNPSPVALVGKGPTRKAENSLSGGIISNRKPRAFLDQSSFCYTGSNRGDFYRYLRDHIPIVSAGIWTWTHLCSTPQRRELIGLESEVKRAGRILDSLEKRIYPTLGGDAHGLTRLCESFFQELFTLGRFAARIKLLPDGTGISHIEVLDSYQIRWQRQIDGRARAFLEREDGKFESLNPDLFFHRTLVSDVNRPEGVEPLASIPFVIEIEQQMLEDMARSSHNAGTPRLQIRITPPAPQPGEDEENYHDRINSYFDRTVRQFNELEPDDNIFSWSDIEVETIGGSGRERSTWKLNREQVIEDVVTGLKLFPWALGRSHGTTKNWIFAQYNLLMQIVDSIQTLGKDMIEWLMQLELRLAGNLSEARWCFDPNQDPFIVERNRAALLRFERIDRMVQRGYISLDQGARELGYPGAFRQEKSE